MPKIDYSRAVSQRLSQPDLADLHRSGLTDRSIYWSGAYTTHDPSLVRQALHRVRDPSDASRGALVFVYYGADGRPDGYVRIKPRYPRTDRKGKVAKYDAPLYVSPRAYILPAARQMLADPLAPLFITEGEKKTIALLQAGYAAIGIAGVWAWKEKGKDDLLPDFATLPLAGRPVYLVFDWDPKEETRRHVQL